MEKHIITTNRFVKNEDLNHHGTLFAGRTSEWFVESGLMAAAKYLPAKNIVCVKVHGMNFQRPVRLGETVTFTSLVVYSGRTSLIANIRMCVGESEILSGFISFVNVDDHGRAKPHGVEIDFEDEKYLALREEAMNLDK